MPTEAVHVSPAPPRRSNLRLQLVGGLALVAALAAVIYGVSHRGDQARSEHAWADARAVPAVLVVRPVASTSGAQLSLPGSLAGLNAAQIYARTSGYLRSWDVDIGAHVRTGQVMAVIETPELDQQLLQARADLQSALANQQLAQTTARRWNGLVADDAVSRQEADEKNGDFAVKSALVNASRANVARLLALKGFAQIRAPFDGVVTSRTADIGALINAGATGAQPLFTVTDSSELRVYVRAPQVYAAAIKPGMQAELSVPEYPARTFEARLVSTSGAISDQSGTLLVELRADNREGLLKPGAFAQVSFDLPTQTSTLRLPASTLIFRNKGLQVAVVGPDDRVLLKPVTIAHDLGQQVEISGGLSPGDRVVDNPTDSLASGDLVRVTSPHA